MKKKKKKKIALAEMGPYQIALSVTKFLFNFPTHPARREVYREKHRYRENPRTERTGGKLPGTEKRTL